jgi:hypothetical protein
VSDLSQGDLSPKQSISCETAQLLRLADFDGRSTHRIFSELRDYWHGLRRGRGIPMRSDVEPRGISRALDYAFILERIAPGAGRFRLAGRHLIELTGAEVRGMPIAALLNPESRGRLSDVLESVFKGPQIAEIDLRTRSEIGRRPLTARLLLLPLRSDLGDVTRVLGCLIAHGEMKGGPHRFDLVDFRVLPVAPGGRTINPSASSRGFIDTPPMAQRADGSDPVRRRRPIQNVQAQADLSEQPLPTSPEGRRAMFRVITTGGRNSG